MMSTRLGTGSLTASLLGLVALIGDVAALLSAPVPSSPGLSSALEPAFAAADIAGFLLGLLASRTGRSSQGTAGLHLSWAPIIIVLVLLAAYRPQTAAGVISRLAALILAAFNGLADTVSLLVSQ